MQPLIIALLIAKTAITSTSLETAISHQDSTFSYKDKNTIILNVPYINQITDLPEDKKSEIGTTACGPAALTMVLNFHGYHLSLYDVIDKLPETVYLKGKRFYDLPKGPEYFEAKSDSFENTYKSIFNHLSDGEPIIINVQNYDGITGHAMVVVGMINYDGKRAESLVIHDPYVGAYREFKYINEQILQQPEGYTLPIGTLRPFIITETDKYKEKIKFQILNQNDEVA